MDGNTLNNVPTRTIKNRLWGLTVTGHDGDNNTVVSFVIGDIRRKPKGGFFIYNLSGKRKLVISDEQLFAIYDGKQIAYNGNLYSVKLENTYPMPSKHRISRLIGKNIGKDIVDGIIVLYIGGDNATSIIHSIDRQDIEHYRIYVGDNKRLYAVLKPYQLAELVDVHRTSLGKPVDLMLN